MIFRIAVALLKFSRKELLMLDFEGVLRYFRVHLPKQFLDSQETVDALFKVARGVRINEQLLVRYSEQYDEKKRQALRLQEG